MLNEVHDRYLEFRSLWSSELLCTKNAGKLWIRLSFLANVSQSLFRQVFNAKVSYYVYGSLIHYCITYICTINLLVSLLHVILLVFYHHYWKFHLLVY